MKNILCLCYMLVSASLSFAQIYATTDEGKRVKLNNDGTWEYLNDNSNPLTSYTYLNGVKYVSGFSEYVTDDISISIIKKPEQTMIMFWQDVTQEINFFKWVWNGSVSLYLENGEIINLTDRKLNGHNIVDANYTRYACYYLTPSECLQLKKSPIIRVSYSVQDYGENGRRNITIEKNISTLKNQLISLGL